MDMEYLFFLQGLREATNGIFDEFFNMISKIAVDIMPILPFLVYWAIDKSWGYRFLGTQWGGELINGTVKLTVCAYRPWIRDPRIIPAGDSKVAATGYSFPSGHTMCATANYGSTFVWQRKKRKLLAAGCCVLIALTGFSRNFLGVHTPQDVIVGFLETSIIIIIAGFIQKKVEGNGGLADKLTICGVIFSAGVIVYILVKSYPMDYVDGELLVDPQKMMKDTFSGAGGFIGLMVGSYIERHYVKYEIPKGSSSLPVMVCVGTACVFIWERYLAAITFKIWFGANWGSFISSLIMIMLGVVVFPICIMNAAKKETSQAVVQENP
jgi:membrane-associated phospholipid phosphatase